MKNPTLPTGELLMRELDWMRRLARQLAGDPERAEDLTQDALVVALERPPRDGERLRGWLRRVMQNLFREGLRTRANRRAREEHWARPEALPPEDDLARGVHLQRLQQINEEATRLQDLLQQRAPGRQWAEALGAFADRLHGLRQQWATPVHHPVSQQNMGEGEIELF